MTSLDICNLCKHRQRPCNGSCVCLKDDLRRDITETHLCPPEACPHKDDLASGKLTRIDPEPPPSPIPYPDWPAWAKLVGTIRSNGDIGIGDTFKRWTGPLGAAYQAAWKLAGMPCGCGARREEWNAMYPYSSLLGKEA